MPWTSWLRPFRLTRSRSLSARRPRSARLLPGLEKLEDRALLAGAIPNALIHAVSDNGRFVLYSPVIFDSSGIAPDLVPLILRDQATIDPVTSTPVESQLAD